MKIILDYNRTLYDPETDALCEGVEALLRYAAIRNELYLVSRNEPGRSDRLEELGIAKLFTKTAFVEEKTEELFSELVRGDRAVIVIGDRVREEIAVGNRLGYVTIWVQQGKFATELPSGPDEQPTYAVRSVQEIRNILSRYEK